MAVVPDCVNLQLRTRAQTITVEDSSTSTALDKRTVSSMPGVYCVWNITGHVELVISRSAGPNAIVNGLFFGQ